MVPKIDCQTLFGISRRHICRGSFVLAVGSYPRRRGLKGQSYQGDEKHYNNEGNRNLFHKQNSLVRIRQAFKKNGLTAGKAKGDTKDACLYGSSKAGGRAVLFLPTVKNRCPTSSLTILRLATAASAAILAVEGRPDLKPAAPIRIDIIKRDGLCLTEQRLIDHELDSVTVKNLIGFFWLIQSQSQRGTRSPAPCHEDPDCRCDIALFEILLKHLYRLVCCFKHGSSSTNIRRTCVVLI